MKNISWQTKEIGKLTHDIRFYMTAQYISQRQCNDVRKIQQDVGNLVISEVAEKMEWFIRDERQKTTST